MIEVKRSFSRSPRPNFGFHLVSTSFDLEFFSFWNLRSFDLSNLGVLRIGSVNFFKFLKSVHSKEKDEACLSFLVNIFTKSVHRGGVHHLSHSVSGIAINGAHCYFTRLNLKKMGPL